MPVEILGRPTPPPQGEHEGPAGPATSPAAEPNQVEDTFSQRALARVRSIAHRRDFQKTATWRGTAMVDSLANVLYMTNGNWAAAASIIGMEQGTKFFEGWAFEWAFAKLWPEGTNADFARSLVSSVAWRAIGSIDMFVVALLATGEPASAAAMAGVDLVSKLVLRVVHDEAWRHFVPVKGAPLGPSSDSTAPREAP